MRLLLVEDEKRMAEALCKACGMLLARKIIHTELPEYRSYFEPHDSFYIGSDVFYTYIVSNNCWETRIAQRTEEGYFSKAGALKEALLSGSFPPDIREKFRTVLEYFGQSPIIVRSSSFLEDGFGNAFAGKYESVFHVNQGSPEERLKPLKRQCGLFMPAQWTSRRWSTESSGGCSTRMSRWRFLSSGYPGPITAICFSRRQQA